MLHKNYNFRKMQRDLHIKKRKRICHYQETSQGSDWSKMVPMEWYNVDGKYDKGKIHCGCPLCKPYKGYRPSGKNELENFKANLAIKEYYEELATA